MVLRRATCSCEKLTITVEGDPVEVRKHAWVTVDSDEHYD